MGWKQDKQFTDPYLSTVKAVCGIIFIGEASQEEDQERNTDLIVLRINGVRIAVRLRRKTFWDDRKHPEYKGEFTVRSWRPSGRKTEWNKILEGWGDYFFYGFCGHTPPNLMGFGILNLSEFRQWIRAYHREFCRDPGVEKANADGVKFRVMQWSEIPDAAIHATWPTCVANGKAKLPEEFRSAVQLALRYTATM